MFFIPIGDDVNKRNFPAVGVILIVLNVLVYLYMARLWRESVDQIDWYTTSQSAFLESYHKTEYGQFIHRWGVIPEHIRRGHVMCVVTYMFLHGGFFHLLGNMLMLWVFVGTLEDTLGQGRFLCCYTLWGIMGGIAHAAMNWDSPQAMIGASGAIAGMIGAYLVAFGALTKIRIVLWIFVYPYKFSVPAGAYVLFWILSQLAGMDDAQKYGDTSVAWYAHVGGFAAGMGTMFLFRREALSRLARDKSGNLIVLKEEEETNQTAAAAKAIDGATGKAADFYLGPPEQCPECGTAVSEKHNIHESLMRCPNPVCQKLIFFQ